MRDKIWYRNRSTGDRGFLVQEDGVDYIQLDRPMEVLRYKYTKDAWAEDTVQRPMTKAQVAHIAFTADAALCKYLGLHQEAKRDWLSLKDKEREKLIKEGIDADERLRRRLWEAVTVALDGKSV